MVFLYCLKFIKNSSASFKMAPFLCFFEQLFKKLIVMKRTLLIAFLLFTTSGLFAQTDITEAVTSLIRTGNAKELSSHFTSTLDLAVEDVDDIFSKAQAEQILKKFFEKHKVESYEIKHSGQSKLGIQYRIGDLTTTKGEEYRVTFNMKVVSKKYYIHQFRIE
jgi:hypothetical protein